MEHIRAARAFGHEQPDPVHEQHADRNYQCRVSAPPEQALVSPCSFVCHRIPRLGRDVDEKLAACNEDLKRLPPQITGEPASYVLALLSSFCVDVQSHIMGGPGTEALVQHNRRVYEEFKRAIRSTAPRFIPQPSANDVPPNFDTQETEDSDEDEDFEGALQVGSSGENIYLKDMRLHIQRCDILV